MPPTWFLDHLAELFVARGHAEYGGEAVSQLDHALQAASLAAADGATSADITAALLHDIGHLLHRHGVYTPPHEELGVRFLVKHFPPTVTEPVRLHVAAKRYLCAAVPGYAATLSEASVVSLRIQGGPMSEAEVREFETHPHFAAAIALRKRDDEAKVVGRVTQPFAAFRPHLEACLVRLT